MDYGIESSDHNYGHMIQSFHRFLVDTLVVESNTPQNPWLVRRSANHEDAAMVIVEHQAPSPITQLFGVDAINVITCNNCGGTRVKGNLVHIVDLVYPKKVL